MNVNIEPFLQAMTNSIGPSDIISILVQVVGVGIGFFLMWLGVRKAICIFQNALYGRKLDLEEKKEGFRQSYYSKHGVILSDNEIDKYM